MSFTRDKRRVMEGRELGSVAASTRLEPNGLVVAGVVQYSCHILITDF